MAFKVGELFGRVLVCRKLGVLVGWRADAHVESKKEGWVAGLGLHNKIDLSRCNHAIHLCIWRRIRR